MHECLVNIARGENPELDLRIGAVLLNLRELAEPDCELSVRAALRRGVLRAENSAYEWSYAQCLRAA